MSAPQIELPGGDRIDPFHFSYTGLFQFKDLKAIQRVHPEALKTLSAIHLCWVEISIALLFYVFPAGVAIRK